MNRILLADDHAMMLEGLRSILQSKYEIVGTAMNGRELVEQAGKLRPDLVVLDISMPELNGIEACRQIARKSPSIRIVFVTQQLDPSYIRAAFDAGAIGYVAKQSASKELLDALHSAFLGQYYVTPLVNPTGREGVQGALVSRANPAGSFGMHLTPRQREVLQLIAEGRTSKEVASALNISIRTAEFHRVSIMDALGVRTTAELTRYALLHGLIG